MFIAILFGAIVSALVQGTADLKDCQAYKHEPKACRVSKILDEAGKK
jgi:hypothetical protein